MIRIQGRWLGEAETERSPQICSNLSVTFGESDFNQAEAAGFINIWGLPTKVQALREQGKL